MSSVLDDAGRGFLAQARTATLATIAPDGRPRLVPICFALAPDADPTGRAVIWTPIDEKPKRDPDPHQLGRVTDILVLPEVALLVSRWDEDWSRLAWLRVYGRAEMLEPQPHERQEHELAVAALRAKYPQYAGHALESRPVIRITVTRTLGWGNPG